MKIPLIPIEERTKEDLVFQKVNGRDGCWYIGKTQNSGDWIFFSSDPFQYGETKPSPIKITTEGGVEEVSSLWRSSSEELFLDTGMDLRDKHLTFGVVSEIREIGDLDIKMEEILHADESPVLGTIDRIDSIAQDLANGSGKTLFYIRKGVSQNKISIKHPK